MSVIHDDVLSQKHPSPDSTKHTVYCQPSTKLHRTSATTHGLPSGICEGPAEGVSAVLTRSARAYAACPACRADGARDRLRISRTGAHRAGRAGRALAAGAEGTKKKRLRTCGAAFFIASQSVRQPCGAGQSLQYRGPRAPAPSVPASASGQTTCPPSS